MAGCRTGNPLDLRNRQDASVRQSSIAPAGAALKGLFGQGDVPLGQLNETT
jgi:hypothetical protein